MSQSIDSLQPLNISWDPSCLPSNTPSIDITLYAPDAPHSRLHLFQHIPLNPPSYQAQLMPRWWNATPSITLQLAIIPSNINLYENTLPAGPVFTATYSPPSDGSIPPSADPSQPDSPITQVGAISSSHDHLPPGKTAAAVLVPLLFILLLLLSYLKYQRSKASHKRKQWSDAVDKRMSTISADWKSISAAGASAAIRNSMAAPGSRNSSFSFAIRPSSTFGVEEGGGNAGVGVARQTTQMRPGVGLRNPSLSSSTSPATDRVSRVSFAPDTRVSRVSFADSTRGPSVESRRTRAFHTAIVPPVPALPLELDQEEEGVLSPRQKEGPLTLTPEDIRSRIAGRQTGDEEEMDQVMPALSMMRTGSVDDDLLFTPPAPPTPSYNPGQLLHSPISPFGPTSPGMQAMPMPMSGQAMGMAMSPDEMLKVYARGRSLGLK